MTIISSEQFEAYKEKSEILLKQICQYEDESEAPTEIINEYKQVSSAIIEPKLSIRTLMLPKMPVFS
jgi:hypothetical protein